MIQLEPSILSILVYVAIFVGVLLAFEGVRQLIFREETRSEARNRRMQMIQQGASTEAVLQLLRDPAMQRTGIKGGPIRRLRRLLVQAGLTIGVPVFLLGATAFGMLVAVGVSLKLTSDLAIAAGVVAGVAVPFFLLMALKETRAKKLTTQLPDALDLMSRGLKVGHPVSVTVANVAKDMPDPIGTEFGIIQDQISYGDDVATAFRDFADRVATEDANYLAVSIGIQHGTGGNLARILGVLSKVIRDRHTMRKRIKAISAEGRLSGTILSILPVFIYVSIEVATPSFYGDVRNDPLYPMFAYSIFGLVLLQALLLYKLVKFKF